MVFRTTFLNNVTTSLPADVDPKTLIGLLHDHSFLITMQPIVTRHEIRDRDPRTGKVTYDIWEAINILPFGLWKREIQFTGAFTDRREGVVSEIEAPMGFLSEATYTVKPGEAWDGEGAGWVLEESIESSCNVIMKWFIEGTMVPVRQKMHQQIMEAVREREKKVRESRDSAGSDRSSGGVERPLGNFI